MSHCDDCPSPNAEAALAPSGINTVQTIARFLRVVRYRKEIVLAALVVSGVLGGLYFVTAPRIYQAGASLLVLQTGEQWTPQIDGEHVVKDLMTTYKNLFTAEAVLEAALKRLGPEHRADLAKSPPSAWTDILRNQLTVNVTRGTNIIEISYRSCDPKAAPVVVDAMLSAYLEFMDGLHKSTARDFLEILTRQKGELEQQLAAKQAELLAARANAKELVIRDGDQGVNVVIKRAVTLNDALIKARERRLECESRVRAIEDAVRKGENLQQHALAMADSVGREVLLQQLGLSTTDAYVLAQMNQQVLRDKGDLRAAQQLYGPAHHTIRNLESRIQVAEQFLQNRRQMQQVQFQQLSSQQLAPLLVQMARQQLGEAAEQESLLQASYEDEKRQSLELDSSVTRLEMLDNDLTRLRSYYDVVLQRIKDIDLSQDNVMLRTSILSRPEVPSRPVSPRLSLVGLISLFLGAVGGLGVVYVLDLLDDRFRSPEELQIELGVPVLAMVGRLEPQEGGGGIEDVHVFTRPNSPECEAFRTLRTALAFAEGGVHRLVISSTEPGDGKTTVAVNLAAACAQAGKRTLLIDADMRRPGLTPLLNLKGPRGLAPLLRDPVPLAQAVTANLQPSIMPNLDVIPSGPRPLNPMELLAGDRFNELLTWAETAYDQIVVDSPPALAVSDSAIIGRLVDGVVLAVRPEKNRRRLVARAAGGFAPLGVRVLGVVLNQAESGKGHDYYGYGYGYHYDYGYGADEPDDEEGDGQDFDRFDDFDKFDEAPRKIIRRAV